MLMFYSSDEIEVNVPLSLQLVYFRSSFPSRPGAVIFSSCCCREDSTVGCIILHLWELRAATLALWSDSLFIRRLVFSVSTPTRPLTFLLLLFIISSTLLTHTQFVKIRDFSLNPCLLFLFIPKCYYNGQYIN